MRLACCIAAEETAAQADAIHTISTNVASACDDLADAARKRISLSTLLGSDATAGGPELTATAVSTTLFGSSGIGSRDDDGSNAYFKGSVTDYYDPRNSFIDCVLARRVGIPITLSLVYMEVCQRLGLHMVGLNAPGHLLLAPADPAIPFVVDPFFGGRLMSADEASLAIARNAGSSAQNPRAQSDPAGVALLQMLRSRPMDSHMWCARMLRNLRAIHGASNDVVRMIGAAERLRLVGEAMPSASSPAEQVACATQLASGILALRWDARRDEARRIIEDTLSTRDEAVSPELRRQLQALLADDWFQRSDSIENTPST